VLACYLGLSTPSWSRLLGFFGAGNGAARSRFCDEDVGHITSSHPITLNRPDRGPTSGLSGLAAVTWAGVLVFTGRLKRLLSRACRARCPKGLS